MYEFDPTETLIRVNCEIRLGGWTVRLPVALDTGCTKTIISADALGQLGDSFNFGAPSPLVTAGGAVFGSPLLVDQFSALGQTASGFEILVFDIPSELGIDGLLGLDFFRGTRPEIDFINGFIEVKPE